MKTKSFDLAWIVAKDFSKTVKFYTEVVGLKLMKSNEEYGWAELQGHEGGATLGICKADERACPLKAGQNACPTFTVEDLEKAKKDIQGKGVKLVGDVQEVPGHVKLQLAVDADGNHFQLVQMLGDY